MNSANIVRALWIGEATPARRESLVASLKGCLNNSALRWEVQSIAALSEVPATLARSASPHVVLIDADHYQDTVQLEGTIRGLRELDRGLCLLMLIKETSADSAMYWLDAGATGILHPNFKPSEVSEAVQEVLLKRVTNAVARHPRAPARHRIELRLASLEQALAAETLNLGTGGMFVRLVPPDVKMGDRVDFDFVISQEVSIVATAAQENPLLAKMDADLKAMGSELQGKKVGGSGVVVWIRSRHEKDMPEGMGIQFSELDPEATRWVERFVSTHRVRAFVPKS